LVDIIFRAAAEVRAEVLLITVDPAGVDLWTEEAEMTTAREDVIIEQLHQTLREDHPFAGADPDHVTAVAVLIADRAEIMTRLRGQIVLLLRSE